MALNVRIVDEVPVTPDPHTMYLVEVDANTFDIKMTDSTGDVRSLPDAPGGGGSGTVTSVEGIQPDVNGNVDLGLGTGAYMEPSLPGEEATGSQLVRGDDPRLSAATLPVGLGTYLLGDTAGWLRCNGAIYLKSAYPDLAALVGLITNQNLESSPWTTKIPAPPTISGTPRILKNLPNGGLIMVTSSTGVYTCEDGWTWVERKTTAAVTVVSLAVGDDTILLTSSSTTFASTDGGHTWASTGSPNRSVVEYCSSSGLFISFLGSDGASNLHYSYSEDGVTWTDSFTGSNAANAKSIVCIGNTVILGAGNGDMWKSTDGGLTFSLIAASGANHGLTSGLGGVSMGFYLNGKLIFLGDVRDGSHQYFFATTGDEGSTWTTGVACTVAANNVLLGGSIINGNLMIVGASGRFTFTANGTSWSHFQLGPSVTNRQLAAFNGRLFLASESTPLVVSTSQTPSPGAWTRFNANLTTGCYDGSVILASGQDNPVWRSPDGVNWTELVNPATGLVCNRIEYVNGTYVMLLATTTGAIYYKTNLDYSWQVTGGTQTQHPSCIAYGAGVYVVGYGGALLRSGADLTNLTTRTSQFGSSWIGDVIWAGTQFVACGETSRVTTSPDGITWTSRTTASSGLIWRGLAFSGTVYVVVGDGGKIDSSTNATSWTNRTSNAGTDALHSVAYGGGVFVAVGANGRIVTSPNGTTWTNRTSPSTTTWRRVIWAGDRFILFGDNRTIAVMWPYSYDPVTEFKLPNVASTPESGGTTLLKFYLKT